jgi:hypothetical protein
VKLQTTSADTLLYLLTSSPSFNLYDVIACKGKGWDGTVVHTLFRVTTFSGRIGHSFLELSGKRIAQVFSYLEGPCFQSRFEYLLPWSVLALRHSVCFVVMVVKAFIITEIFREPELCLEICSCDRGSLLMLFGIARWWAFLKSRSSWHSLVSLGVLGSEADWQHGNYVAAEYEGKCWCCVSGSIFRLLLPAIRARIASWRYCWLVSRGIGVQFPAGAKDI